MPEQISTEHVFAVLLSMKAGEHKTFLLDHDPQPSELDTLNIEGVLYHPNPDAAFLIRRSARTLYVHCLQ